MSFLSRTSLLLAAFFAFDKLLAIFRQILIARQFGLSSELDAFNVANNLPDLLFALISGGALAMAFIPVLANVLTVQGRKSAWDLFSRIANLAFLVSAFFAVVVAVLAAPIVRTIIAPGFTLEQQELVVELMRLDLIAMLLFSISGLVIAGLQANQHFLLPAMAPILYNVGQIFGALVLAPEQGTTLAGFTLPAYGLGVYGLVYGVIGGAAMHLLVQVPGLLAFRFRWIPRIDLNNPDVRRVLRVLGPRLVTMLLIQLIFLVRDNLASHLAEGAVTALAYGWMIQQLPETLIGTAIGTAILPTLAEHISRDDLEAFRSVIDRAVRVLLALTIPTAVILSVGLRPLVEVAFGFDEAGTDLLMWVTRGFLFGLLGHSLLEVAARAFYAQQDAMTPLFGAALNVSLYILLGNQLYRLLGAPGISLTDSLAFTAQAIFLLFLLARRRSLHFTIGSTFVRALAGAALSGSIILGLRQMNLGIPSFLIAAAAMMLGAVALLPFVWREIRVLLRL
jgi:putative peptidoglycan lipid II flippase